MSIEHGGPSPEEMGIDLAQINKKQEGKQEDSIEKNEQELEEEKRFNREDRILKAREELFGELERSLEGNEQAIEKAKATTEELSKQYRELTEDTKGADYRYESAFLAGINLALAEEAGTDSKFGEQLLQESNAPDEIQLRFREIAHNPEKRKLLIDAEAKLENIKGLLRTRLNSPDGINKDSRNWKRFQEGSKQRIEIILQDLEKIGLAHDYGRLLMSVQKGEDLIPIRGFTVGGWEPTIPAEESLLKGLNKHL